MAVKKDKKKIFGKTLFWSVFLVFVISASVFLIFNSFGIIRYSEVSSRRDKLQIDTSFIKMENKKLEEEIDSLKRKEPAKIEKVAREKYNMSHPNEIIFKVEEK